MTRWIGPVKCADCELPVEIDALVCPYCHSTAPSRGPWHGTWTSAAIMAIIAVVLFLVAWLCDHFWGTGLVAFLLSLFKDQSASS